MLVTDTVSLVLIFDNHEDVIGQAVRRLAAAVAGQFASFEIVAVDRNSDDNSHAVLAMLRSQVSELRVLHVPTRMNPCEFGASHATGQIVALLAPETDLASVQGAIARVLAGDLDVEARTDEYVVAHRQRGAAALVGVRMQGGFGLRRWARRLLRRGVRITLNGGAPTSLLHNAS